MQIGLDRIAERVAEISAEVADLLTAVPGARLVAGRESRGIVSFVHDTLDPHDIRRRLAAHGVNVWVNTPAGTPRDARTRETVLPSVRVSPHYVTNADDLARLRAGLAGL
jgi:selenocysteine lyase/cysteine desulfurase